MVIATMLKSQHRNQRRVSPRNAEIIRKRRHKIAPQIDMVLPNRLRHSVRLMSDALGGCGPTGAMNIAVLDRGPVCGGIGPVAMQVVFQDRVDRGIGPCPDHERPLAGRFQRDRAVWLGQSHDADAGAEPLLGMAAVSQDHLDQHRGIGPDLRGPSFRWPRSQAARATIRNNAFAIVTRTNGVTRLTWSACDRRWWYAGRWKMSWHQRATRLPWWKISTVRAVSRTQSFSRRRSVRLLAHLRGGWFDKGRGGQWPDS